VERSVEAVILRREEWVAAAEEKGSGDRLGKGCGVDWSTPKPKWLARSIEERFLDCVARLVRRSERGRKNRATSLGMTSLGGWLSGLPRIRDEPPTPHFAKKGLDLIENKGLRLRKRCRKTT